MKNLLATLIFSLAVILTTNSYAEVKTIKLLVPGITCPSCPYIVKDSISNVHGVQAVKVTMVERTATVTFEDKITDVAKIQKATIEVGYESFVLN